MNSEEQLVTELVTEERLRVFVGRKRDWHCSVRPRYGPGSGAAVSPEIALRVALDEARCYEHALSGVYGEETQTKARALGLLGIAECLVETRKAWHVLDLITGEVYDRPFPEHVKHSTRR